MKKITRIGIMVLTCLATLVIGVFVGTELTKVTKEEYDVDKVVLVNLDEGVEYNGEERNFSVELLNESANDYPLTGLSDAERGLEEGRYAAYIIIPSTFSESVVSINTTQNPIQLSYEVGGKIAEKAKENTILNVSDFENKMSKDISNLYISSILGSYHTGQDGAGKVLENDKADTSMIMAINSRDLVDSVKVTDVDRVQRSIAALDVESQSLLGETIIGNVDTSYKKFLGESSEQLNSIKSDYSTFDTGLSDINSKIGAIPTISDDSGTAKYQLTTTEQYLAKLNTNNTAYIGTHNTQLSTFRASYTKMMTHQDTTLGEISKSTSMMKAENEIKSVIVNYLSDNPTKTLADAVGNTKVKNDVDKILPAFIANCSDWTQVGEAATLEDYLNYSLNPVNAAKLSGKYDNAQIAFVDIIANSNAMNNTALPSDLSVAEESGQSTETPSQVLLPTSNGINTSVASDLTSLNTDQKAALNNLKDSYTSQKGTSESLLQSVTAYDPISFIKEKEVEGHVKDYKSNQNDLLRSVEAKTREFSEFTDKVYDDSYKHIDTLKTDLTKANETSNTLVESGLTNLKTVKTTNSKENTEYLGTFINTLPYTRNDSLLNTKAVKFIVRPVSATGTINNLAAKEQMNLFMPLVIAIAAIGVAILGLGAKLAFDKIKEKE